jgi:trk system potassium uptake protein TrkA
MKFIVIGLGNFGAALCTKLTSNGHEVIGVDNNIKRVEMLQDKITHTICADTTDDQSISALPIKEADYVVIGIGEDIGASIMTAALLKQKGAKKMLSRVISPLHQTVLQAMGIEEFVHPEEETAERLANKFDIQGVVDSFSLSQQYKVIEAKVPAQYVGKTVLETNFRNIYNVNILTIIKIKGKKGIFGTQNTQEVTGVVNADTRFEENDILVLFGRLEDIQKIIND